MCGGRTDAPVGINTHRERSEGDARIVGCVQIWLWRVRFEIGYMHQGMQHHCRLPFSSHLRPILATSLLSLYLSIKHYLLTSVGNPTFLVSQRASPTNSPLLGNLDIPWETVGQIPFRDVAAVGSTAGCLLLIIPLYLPVRSFDADRGGDYLQRSKTLISICNWNWKGESESKEIPRDWDPSTSRYCLLDMRSFLIYNS